MGAPRSVRKRVSARGAALLYALSSAVAASAEPPTCDEIALEIGARLAEQGALGVSFWDDPGHRGAAIGATTFTVVAYPAVAYLALEAIRGLPAHARYRALGERITALRALSAQRGCFSPPRYSY